MRTIGRDRKCVYFTGNTRSNLPFSPSFQVTITLFNVSWIAKYLVKRNKILSLSHASTLATKPLNCIPFCLLWGHGSSIFFLLHDCIWAGEMVPAISGISQDLVGTRCILQPEQQLQLEGCCISEMEEQPLIATVFRKKVALLCFMWKSSQSLCRRGMLWAESEGLWSRQQCTCVPQVGRRDAPAQTHGPHAETENKTSTDHLRKK